MHILAAIVAATLGAVVGRFTASTPLSAGTAIVVYTAMVFIAGKAKDPYGSFHLSLNATQEGKAPSTEWLNMGYWKVPTLPSATDSIGLEANEC